MKIIEFLQSESGLAFLHFTQTIMFSMMVYILATEYLRTKREDLIFKLIASISITAINMATTTVLILKIFYQMRLSQKVIPLLFNALFAVIVITLVRAFVYSFIEKKKRFDLFIKIAAGVAFGGYAFIQIYWLYNFKPDMIFAQSFMQLIYSIFFLLMIGISIYYLVRFRTTYRLRLVLAFSSIALAQFVNIYGVLLVDIPSGLKILRSAAPLLVPTMFGSVVFKELIENLVTMAEHLKRVFENQRTLVFDLVKMGSDLSNHSDELVKMSLEGWQKLSVVVENIYSQENDRKKILTMTSSTSEIVKETVDLVKDKAKMLKTSTNPSFGNDDNYLDERESVKKEIDNMQIKFAANRKVFDDTREVLSNLQISMSNIASLLETLDEISDQTNMLSLNASIEAARAGEEGKGFAIVADEIGKLAEGSRENTSTINKLMQSIKNGIEKSNELIIQGARDMGKSLVEVKKIKNFFEDLSLTSDLYETIVSTNAELALKTWKNSAKIYDNMQSTDDLLQKNQDDANTMKESISNHIRDIEAIAGVSDNLNGMIKELNDKTDAIIRMTERLRVITG